MPTAPPRPCPTCGAVRCQQHRGRAGWVERPPVVERWRGRKRQQARIRLFARQPFCEPCEQAGRLTMATIRDHRVPLAEGGTEDETNEQAICYRCHVEKTHRESMRARTRSGVPR
jgi:5-methylcytosine-specific restriction protein A